MKFEIFYPVKPKVINQLFGNVAPMYTQLGLLGHNGIDFGAVHGQPVYASHDGVCYVGEDVNEGIGVVIRTDKVFDYTISDGLQTFSQVYFKSIYWHLMPNVAVITGQHVKCGDLLGYADNTGMSTGDHLHFGIKPQLPGEPNGTWWNVEQRNGYLGAIDPMPYFNGLFAEDYKISEEALAAAASAVAVAQQHPEGSYLLELAKKLLITISNWLKVDK